MERRRRPAPRRALLLACAAATVPALLLAGCSSGDSGSGSGSDSGSSSGASSGADGTSGGAAAGSSDGKAPGGGSPATTPALAPERFSTLPDACGSLTKDTVSALVPKAKSAAGKAVDSDDPSSRAGCSWTGNGTDGYQYRWLSVTFQRFTSAPGSPAEDQASERLTNRSAELGKAKGASTKAVSGVGDQASSVSGKATVAKVTSQNDTLLVRTGNVLVIVEYDGAGLEGKKNPSASTVDKGALRAAKDAVAAVVGGGTGAAEPTGKPTGKASDKPTAKATAKAAGSDPKS